MSTATLSRPALRSVPRPAARPTPRVRITRRGRLVVLAVLVALLMALFTLGRSATSQADADGAPVAAVDVTTVESGETLWAVAKRIAPDHDTRKVVAQIRDLNDMGSSTLQVGQQLLLPVGAG